MGMYTELIFRAELKKETPELVINSLKYMMGETSEKPIGFPLPGGECDYLFQGGGSFSFGYDKPVLCSYYSGTYKKLSINISCNTKNYKGEIETFLKWIAEYIDTGSGERDMYAIVTCEDGEPELYFKYNENFGLESDINILDCFKV